MHAQNIRRRAKYTPVAPFVIIGAVLAAGLMAVVVRDRLTAREPTLNKVAVQRVVMADEAEDWSFALGPNTAQILRHRPGLTPVDMVRSRAFGWTGLTIHEVTSRPQYLRILRHGQGLTPIDLVRNAALGR